MGLQHHYDSCDMHMHTVLGQASFDDALVMHTTTKSLSNWRLLSLMR